MLTFFPFGLILNVHLTPLAGAIASTRQTPVFVGVLVSFCHLVECDDKSGPKPATPQAQVFFITPKADKMNIWQVAEIDKALTINDMREADIQTCDRKLWIYWAIPAIGKTTGFKGVRKISVRQAKNLINRLQQAVDLAEQYE